MKYSFPLIALFLSTGMAEAALPKLSPGANEAPTCFKREYTAEEMRRNPRQLLQEMYVKVSHRVDGSGSDAWEWMPAEVVGVNVRGDFYGNTAGCQLNDKGILQCQIDCDGGSFALSHSKNNKGSVLFTVTKDYYFPLFKNHMSYDEGDENGQTESISLEGADNSVYRLVPADPRTCDTAIQRTLGSGEGGC